MASVAQRVFAPGDGAAPPARTGREHEEAVLRGCLAELENGRSPPHNVVLIGPRGNGKTVLLNWFKRACRDAGNKVDALALTPGDIPTRAALAGELSPPSWWRRLLPRKLAVSAVGSVAWETRIAATNLTRELTARCRRRPLAVLLDEAHTLAADVGGSLLNASQAVRDEAPFLLVLAGTPGLLAHLGTMNASFSDRLAGGLLGIGRLDEADAGAAIEMPLAARDVRIDCGALKTVVAESQRYPYFLQLWGAALWKQRLAADATRLQAKHVEAARAEVLARVAEYYQQRYRELEAAGLLSAAVAVATALPTAAARALPGAPCRKLDSFVQIFASQEASATDGEVDAALQATGMEADARLAAREGLHRLGYIWCPPGQVPPITWQAGIPSLMAYVVERARSRATSAPGGA